METKGTILIIDDEIFILELLSNILEKKGYSTILLDNGKNVNSEIEKAQPDLILLDVQMPGINGFEICQKLKSNPKFTDIPIIFISSLTNITDRLKGFEFGGVDYITKPFENEELFARVKTQIELFILKKTLKEKNEELVSLNEEYKELNERLVETNHHLQESERLFQTLAQNSPVGIFRTNAEGLTTFVNQKWCKLTGLTFKDAIGKGWLKAIHPDDIERLFKKWENNLNKKTTSSDEYRLVTPDGIVRWVTGNAVPEWNNDKLIGYVGTITEITDLKNSEIELQISKDFLDKIINSVGSPIFVKNNKHEFVLVNNSLCELLNLQPKELIGKTGFEHFPAEQNEVFFAKDNEVFNTGNENINEEFLTNGTGKIRTIITTKTLYTDITGNKFLVGIISDITDLKNSEEKIRKISLHYQTLIEKAPDGIVLVNTEGNFKYVSPSARKIFGYTETEEITGNPAEFTYPEDLPFVLSELGKILQNPTYIPTIQYRFVDKTGKWLWVESTFRNLYSDKNIESIVINFRDITEHKNDEIDLLKAKEKIEEHSCNLQIKNDEYESLIEELRQVNEELSFAKEIAEETQKHLTQITNNIPVYIAHIDKDLKIKFFNDLYCDLFNTSSEFVLDKNLEEIVGSEFHEKMLPDIQKALNGEKVKFETTFVTKDNNQVSFVTAYLPEFEKEKTTVKGFYVLSYDITERKQAEEKIRENEEKFRAIAEYSHQAICIVDQQAKITLVNSQMMNLSGFTKEELLNADSFAAFIAPESIEFVISNFTKFVIGEEYQHQYSFYIIRKDGKKRLFEKFMMDYTDNSGARRLIISMLDITEKKLAEEEIFAQKNELSAIFESSHQIIFLSDFDGIIHKINKQGTEFFKLNNKNWIGSYCGTAFNCINSINETCGKSKNCKYCVIRKSISDTYKTGVKIFNLEGIIKLSDESIMNILVSTTLVHQKDSDKILVTIVDITESKRAELEIKNANNKLKVLLENSGDLLFVLDSDYKYLEYFGIESKDLFVPSDYFIGKNLGKIGLPEELYNKFVEKLKTSFDNKQKSKLEYSLKMPKGEIWYEQTITPIFDDKNNFVNFLCVVNDITKRREVDNKQKELETRYRRLFESAKDGIIILDAETGKIVDVNPFMIELLGYSKEQFIEKTIWEIGFFKDIVANKDKFLELQKMEYVRYEDLPLKTSNGQQIDIEFVSNVYMVNNHKVIQCNIRDITERKMAKEVLLALNTELKIQYDEIEAVNEELTQTNHQLFDAKQRAEESDRLKSAFLANMSHEIRTPMNGILGFSSLLERPNLTKEKKTEYINRIANSGEHLLRIIDDIIDIAKIEANQLSINKELYNIHYLLTDIYHLFIYSKALLSKPELKLLLNSNILYQDIAIETDIVRFTQIFINLINNAIKFTDKGFVEFGFSIKKEANADSIVFYVKDTGHGIPNEKFNMLFKPFSQIYTGRQVEGNGLGLSISKGLVTLLDGEIRVESKVDIGTVFYISFPYSEKKTESFEIKQKSDNSANLNLSDYTIFIAEDNKDSADLLVEMLIPTNITIKHAYNGVELLKLIVQKVPDIILMDINMPEKDGFETLKEIRKKEFYIPVIAHTAYVMSSEKEKCLQAGFDYYISKPVKEEELLVLIKKALKL